MQLFRLELSLQLLLMLPIFIQCSQTIPSETKPLTLGFITDAQEMVDFVRSDVGKLLEETNNTNVNENQNKVLEHLKSISLLVDQLEERYANISRKINSSVVDYSKEGTYRHPIESIVYEMDRMSKYFPPVEDLQSYDISTLKSFTEARPGFTIPGKKSNKALYFGVVKAQQNYKQFGKSVKYMFTTEQMFHLQFFPQHYVYGLYIDPAIYELKAYILIEYSLVARRIAGENVNYERMSFRFNYRRKTENNYYLFQNALEYMDARIWRNDPPKHIAKVTYDEITNLIIGYVENVVNLNKDGSCQESCSHHKHARYEDCYDKDEFCSKQPQCLGGIHDCQFVDEDMNVCQSQGNSTRRYEYIEYDNGRVFGERKDCTNRIHKVESWKRWLIYNCDYCFCLCDQKFNSDRYFNLRKTKSDIADNKVVTGVRFVKKNRIFHLQIQQGLLLPRGGIDESTLEWKPVDDYELTDSNVEAETDYHVLSYENRALNLDQISHQRDPTVIVTGVAFGTLAKHLNLQVHFTQFDYEKGELIANEEYWQWKINTNRTKVNLHNLDVPTRSEVSSEPITEFGEFIEFTNTGIDKDAAQTTIPFIDIQDVVSLVPMPLSGIGLFYKGTPGYGGYVAPRILNFDYAKYIPLPYHPTDWSFDQHG
ncbi:uncharacterized protein LOC132785844 [Drosophila nasuta]|uniref:uncharacterized protein LOC132785844 n=1 Tax=Drosophila nasuta TaxID=42062 RepID=UPI00295E8B9C|nr:uncharacterized protein LOC132785844 [Drosophila nasuta]